MKTIIRFSKSPAVLFAIALFITACGGGGGSVNSYPAIIAPEPSMEAGGFQAISAPERSGKAEIQASADAMFNLGLTSLYNVNAYQLEYWTRSPANELIQVSGMLAIPEKSTPSPLLSFQHATLFYNDEAPSLNLSASQQSRELILASLGYIVFSADYIGYGSSHGRAHPYLQRQPSAEVVADMLQAGKTVLDFNNLATTGQLFMTGYSQGGYVTMAAARHLQENPGLGFDVTAAVYGAGPYDLAVTLETIVENTLSFEISSLPDFLIPLVIATLEEFLLDDTDINFDSAIIERFLSGDRQDDVHVWRPDIPVKLFHGAQDETVPIESAFSTQYSMQTLGADVELIFCQARPSDHAPCIEPYIDYMLDYFAALRIN